MRKALSNVAELACAGLVAALALIVFLQVLNRYLLKTPLAWSEDLAMLLFQWVSFVGAAVAVKRGTHFGIELAVKALPDRLHRWSERAVALLEGIVALIMVVEGTKLVRLNSTRTFATMDLSYVWAYLPIPVAGVLMLVYVGINVWGGKPPQHDPGSAGGPAP